MKDLWYGPYIVMAAVIYNLSADSYLKIMNKLNFNACLKIKGKKTSLKVGHVTKKIRRKFLWLDCSENHLTHAMISKTSWLWIMTIGMIRITDPCLTGMTDDKSRSISQILMEQQWMVRWMGEITMEQFYFIDEMPPSSHMYLANEITSILEQQIACV